MEFYKDQILKLNDLVSEMDKQNQYYRKNGLYIAKKDGNNVYIGKKDDQIDMGLAQIINTFPEREKLRMVFVRESEGVYQFGSRKVYIKIGKGG